MLTGSLRVVLFLLGSVLLGVGVGGAIIGATGNSSVSSWTPFVFSFIVGSVAMIASFFDARSSGYTWCGMLTGIVYIFLGLGYSSAVSLQGTEVVEWWPFVVSTIIGLVVFVWALATDVMCVEKKS